jgi:hypothetical protein
MGQDRSGRPDVRAWVAEVAERNGIPTSAYADRPTFYRLVREAAEHVEMTADVGELVWQTMSGMAHGEWWASLTLNEMEETGRTPNPEHIKVKVTTPVGRLVLFAEVAARYVRGGFDLLAIRRMPKN